MSSKRSSQTKRRLADSGYTRQLPGGQYPIWKGRHGSPRAIPSDLWDSFCSLKIHLLQVRNWHIISSSHPQSSNSYWCYLESHASMPINNLQERTPRKCQEKNRSGWWKPKTQSELQLAINIFEQKESCNIFWIICYLSRRLKTKHFASEFEICLIKNTGPYREENFWKTPLST